MAGLAFSDPVEPEDGLVAGRPELSAAGAGPGGLATVSRSGWSGGIKSSRTAGFSVTYPGSGPLVKPAPGSELLQPAARASTSPGPTVSRSALSALRDPPVAAGPGGSAGPTLDAWRTPYHRHAGCFHSPHHTASVDMAAWPGVRPAWNGGSSPVQEQARVPPMRLKEALTLGGLSARELAARIWKKMSENEVFTRAAGISFYAMLAFIPFLAFILTLVVQLLPDPSGQSQEHGVGNLTVEQLVRPSRRSSRRRPTGWWRIRSLRLQHSRPVGLLSVGLAITLWTASSLFMAIIDAMNRIYGVHETRPFWKLRLTAMMMTILQAVILIGSMLGIVAWQLIVLWLSDARPPRSRRWSLLAAVAVMVLISFALTFYVGPDAHQRWEWITPGSLIGTGIFLVVSYLFRFYFRVSPITTRRTAPSEA